MTIKSIHDYLLRIFYRFPLTYKFSKSFIYWIIRAPNFWRWRQLLKCKEIKLNLGSGAVHGRDGWVTIDLWGADINHNLKSGIPLPNESVNLIYTSHLFEHIPFSDLVKFIEECKRVLKIGGELLVCVPDASLYIKSYLARENFKDANLMATSAMVNTGSFIDQVNYIAYMGGEHHYLFDQENLLNTLKCAGFNFSEIRGFDSKIDLLERAHESIYAKAIKI
jgi:predicted SAM-dependent methyltransferase